MENPRKKSGVTTPHDPGLTPMLFMYVQQPRVARNVLM